ncbi:MAG: hypothetical protein JXM70_13915 [Pirellulales bacterium]|nr:hypothetical protein [Pirellulales bacterium]
MPRIAAVIGVFAVIAICTFVNIKRYPAVWDMVGSSPWFTQDANSSPKDHAPQSSEIANSAITEESAPASQTVQESRVQKTLPSLRPEISSHSNSVGNSWQDYSSSDSVEYPDYGSYEDDYSPSEESSPTETAKTPVYQGLNPGPIKVQDPITKSVATNDYTSDYTSDYASDYTSETPQEADSTAHSGNTDNKWPAEMSPKMKYAAKPPLLESSQQWNTERPVVPVVRPDEDKKNAKPNSKDSSKNKPAKKSETNSDDDEDTVVRHLPKVDPNRKPIRMNIQNSYPVDPIPVYPDTGR